MEEERSSGVDATFCPDFSAMAFDDPFHGGKRHWPLSAAFDAYLHGEERLRDVNPEVRGAARRIFDWLDSSPEAKPQHTLSAAKKRAGRKTGRPA